MVKNSINVKCQTIEYLGKKMNIPDSWEKTEQQTVCEFINGYAFSESEFTNSGYLIIRIQNLRGGKNFLYSNVNLPEKQFVVKGDLLFTWSATFSPFIWNGEKSAFHYHQWKVIPKPFNDKKFVYYHLERVADIIKQMGQSGLGMFHMTKTEMEKFPILKPKELGEQQKIASILSNVDALIERTQKIIEKTERLKKSLMQELLTRGIGHKKFKKVKWMFGKDIEIPEEWEVRTLGKMGKFSKGKGLSKKDLEPHGKIKAIPYTALYTDFDEIIDCDEIKNYASTKNPVMINGEHILIAGSSNMLANIGKAAAINAVNVAIGGDIIIYKTNIDVYFLSYLLSSNIYRNRVIGLSQGITIRHIYPTILQKLTLCLPSLPEQQKIASILSGVDAHIQKNQEYKEKLNRLKKGLMQNLLTGKIRVKI